MPPPPAAPLFHQWYEKVSNQLLATDGLEALSTEFGELSTDESRVHYALSRQDIMESLEIPEPHNVKCDETSGQLRTCGNKSFQDGDYETALALYNDSVCHAVIRDKASSKEKLVECDGENLYSLALGNRSAALYHLQQYELCLADISEALRSGYPATLTYKLYERKGKALLATSCFKEAACALDKALKKLDQSTLVVKKKERARRDMLSLLKESKAGASKEKEKKDRKSSARRSRERPRIPPLSGGRHKVFRSLSAKCDVVYTEEQGRYIVAREEVLPGDVVLVEAPYASVLLPDQYPNHCHHCLAPFQAAIPCTTCPLARYCGHECRQAAWTAYHRQECTSLALIHQSGLGKFGHLAVRTLTKSGLAALLEFRDKLVSAGAVSDPVLLGTSDNGLYEEHSYSAIYHLVTHDKDRATNDLFRRTLMAIFLIKCLERSELFTKNPAVSAYLSRQQDGVGSSPADNLEASLEKLDLSRSDPVLPLDLEAFFAGLVLSHMQLLPCNAHEVPELLLDPSSVAMSVPAEIGAAIYSTLSLFNHSCDPAVNRNFYGATCVVRAIKLIRPGEEVSDNYGAVYAMQSREERHEKLGPQYYFSCGCVPCSQGWPLYPDLPSGSPQWKCVSCLQPLPLQDNASPTQCSACNTPFSQTSLTQQLEKLSALYETAFDKLMQCQVEQAIPHLTAHLEFVDRHLVLPWQHYNNCQETLKQCYSILGNCRHQAQPQE